MISTTG